MYQLHATAGSEAPAHISPWPRARPSLCTITSCPCRFRLHAPPLPSPHPEPYSGFVRSISFPRRYHLTLPHPETAFAARPLCFSTSPLGSVPTPISALRRPKYSFALTRPRKCLNLAHPILTPKSHWPPSNIVRITLGSGYVSNRRSRPWRFLAEEHGRQGSGRSPLPAIVATRKTPIRIAYALVIDTPKWIPPGAGEQSCRFGHRHPGVCTLNPCPCRKLPIAQRADICAARRCGRYPAHGVRQASLAVPVGALPVLRSPCTIGDRGALTHGAGQRGLIFAPIIGSYSRRDARGRYPILLKIRTQSKSSRPTKQSRNGEAIPPFCIGSGSDFWVGPSFENCTSPTRQASCASSGRSCHGRAPGQADPAVCGQACRPQGPRSSTIKRKRTPPGPGG